MCTIAVRTGELQLNEVVESFSEREYRSIRTVCVTMAVARAAEMVIKQELPDPGSSHAPHDPVDPLLLGDRILTLCSENPKGITDEIITKDQPFFDAEKRVAALQRLLSQGRIEVLKQGSTLLYRLKANSSAASMTKGCEKEERLVYQIIEDADNKGIWMRDIRFKSNLPPKPLTRILKVLENKKLIKSVKTVQTPTRKMYMLHGLTPDESLTGGAWYSDQDFESEFVEVLSQHCLKFLQQKAFKAQTNHTDPISRISASHASAQDVCQFITELGISKVRLTVDNITTILNTLIYDGKAEMTVVANLRSAEDHEDRKGGTQKLYRATKPVLQDTGFSRIPCGVCPVINQCCESGAISPSTCVYMREWLTF